MTDDEHGCAKLTVTLPTDLSISLIQMASRLRLAPSQIVECACRDFLTRQSRSPDDPSPPNDGRPSSYIIEMTAREEAHDIPALPPPRSSKVDFRPLGRGPSDRAPEPRPVPGQGAARATSASSEPCFSRSALAAEAFAQEQARRGSLVGRIAQPAGRDAPKLEPKPD